MTSEKRPQRGLILLLLSLLLGRCASVPPPGIPLVTAPGADVSPAQLDALREVISGLSIEPDWVEIARRLNQVIKDGRTTTLSAQAVRTPVRVGPHLCRGELVPLDFERNHWRVFDTEQYAVYDLSVVDPCRQSRQQNARFWIRGRVSDRELLRVLELMNPGSVGATVLPAQSSTLLPDERISAIEGKVDRDGTRIIVTTSTAPGKGRTLEFQNLEGRWTGRVTGGWIASRAEVRLPLRS